MHNFPQERRFSALATTVSEQIFLLRDGRRKELNGLPGNKGRLINREFNDHNILAFEGKVGDVAIEDTIHFQSIIHNIGGNGINAISNLLNTMGLHVDVILSDNDEAAELLHPFRGGVFQATDSPSRHGIHIPVNRENEGRPKDMLMLNSAHPGSGPLEDRYKSLHEGGRHPELGKRIILDHVPGKKLIDIAGTSFVVFATNGAIAKCLEKTAERDPRFTFAFNSEEIDNAPNFANAPDNLEDFTLQSFGQFMQQFVDFQQSRAFSQLTAAYTPRDGGFTFTVARGDQHGGVIFPLSAKNKAITLQVLDRIQESRVSHDLFKESSTGTGDVTTGSLLAFERLDYLPIDQAAKIAALSSFLHGSMVIRSYDPNVLKYDPQKMIQLLTEARNIILKNPELVDCKYLNLSSN